MPWATFNLRVVGAGPEVLSGRRLVDFFYQGAQARGGCPGTPHISFSWS